MGNPIEKIKAFTLNDNCVSVEIDESLNRDYLTLRLLGENRNLLTSINKPDYSTEICIFTDRPMFVELINGDEHIVKYVQGSGTDYYNPIRN
jgi:hypothetical protein